MENKNYYIILGILILIFVLLSLFIGSDFYQRKIYDDFRKSEFKTVLDIKEDINPIKHNPIYLKNGFTTRVPRELFDNLKEGDSVTKTKNSDSICFFNQQTRIFYDYNEFARENLK